jgi:hypothetical protein
VSDIQRAMALAASAGADEVEYAYWAAIAEGRGNTRCDAVSERAYGPLRLLALAGLRTPELALHAQLLDVGQRRELDSLVLDAGCLTTAGTVRLLHRALEAHAAALGYAHLAWISHALARARRALDGLALASIDGNATAIHGQLLRGASALARALAATAEDPMRVPDEIASALAHLLTVYLVASEADAA